MPWISPKTRALALTLVSAALLSAALATAQTTPAPAPSLSTRQSVQARQVVRQALDLIGRGALDEAQRVVAAGQLDPLTRGSLDGYIALRQRRYDEAARALDAVTAADPSRHVAWLYLGLARYQLGQPAAAREALKRAHPIGQTLPGYYPLLARTARLTDDERAAYDTLDEGLSRFHDDPAMLREQALILLELGLYERAWPTILAFLELGQLDPGYHASLFASMLRDGGQLDRAAALLEAARWRYPERPELTPQLAHVYALKGMPLASARLFEVSPPVAGRTFEREAADQHRRAGRTREALRWNARVADPWARALQRFIILTDAGDAERAATLLDTLEPRAAQLDEAIVARAAIVALMTDQRDRARRLIDRLPADSPARRVIER